MWDNRNDANSHLQGTILRDPDGTLVYVHEVSGDDSKPEEFKLTVTTFEQIHNGNARTVPLRDCDTSQLKLGYVNTYSSSNPEAMYVYRQPRRRWKHGLDSSACLTMQSGRSRQVDIYNNVKGFTECLNREYPSFKVAVEKGLAFSRNFAISKEGMLSYKGTVCGVYSKKDKVFLMVDDYKRLARILEKRYAY